VIVSSFSLGVSSSPAEADFEGVALVFLGAAAVFGVSCSGSDFLFLPFPVSGVSGSGSCSCFLFFPPFLLSVDGAGLATRASSVFLFLPLGSGVGALAGVSFFAFSRVAGVAAAPFLPAVLGVAAVPAAALAGVAAPLLLRGGRFSRSPQYLSHIPVSATPETTMTYSSSPFLTVGGI